MTQQYIEKIVSHLPPNEQRLQTLIYSISLFMNEDLETYFERYSRSINELDNFLVNLTDDEINKSIVKIVSGMESSISHSLMTKNIATQMVNIFEILFIHYIHYLSFDTIMQTLNFSYDLLNAIIDYRPEIAHEIFSRFPHRIELLINLKFYIHKRYYSWIEQYLPILIKFKEERIKDIDASYNFTIQLMEQNLDNFQYSPPRLVWERLITHPTYINIIKNEIKQYYYILAQVKHDQPKSDLDKEWIIRYLIRADDYLDTREVRTLLFRQYYIGDMTSVKIPINGDEDTIIQFAHYIQNNCR